MSTRPALNLTNDSAIESVLSEVPYFGVGLVAFAVFTFFLVMKRVTLLSVYLYSSAIFAFGAAILDVSQLLVRGAINVQQGTGMEAVRAIINTSEVGFAVAVGLRFLFWWKFVAERPRGEPPPNIMKTSTYNPREHAHSASWKRWGVIGFILRWGLLLSCLSLPILQILWRVTFRTFGPVYVVESTMEIVISAVFILKIILNIFLTPIVPRWKALVSYSVPILALMINLASAIGSLIMFLFSETTLGRFIQAVELYILILFLLVTAFYKIPTRPPRLDTTSYMVSPPEKGMPTPAEPTPSTGQPLNEPQLSRRLSSWLLARSSRRPSNVRWLVGDGDVERDAADSRQIRSVNERKSYIQMEDEGDARAVTPERSSVFIRVEDANAKQAPAFEQRQSRTSAGFSFSYYGSTQPRDSGVDFPIPPPPSQNRFSTPRVDSPVYGLDGIVNQETTPSRTSPTSLTSLDELLRQQSELDKSIANLRLFSPQGPASPLPTDRITSSASRPSRTDRTYSSISNPSEFSLSIFPDPPKFESERSMPSSKVSSMTIRAKRGTYSTNTNLGEQPGRPYNSRAAGRLDSAGTSYDVTSFIGDLTKPNFTPGHTPSASLNRTAPVLSDVESGDEISMVTAISSKPIRRPTVVTGISEDNEEANRASPKTTSPVSPSSRLRPLLLSTTATVSTMSSPLVPRNPELTPTGPRRMIPRKTSQPRLVISNPRFRREQLETLDSNAFEKPRRAPTVSPS
ncbi:hypothetical protein AAF712_001027 [Marasmius tenuissimus]|uniref:Uncharacterized protein n=1 Tax=Marasmius tenuissimus TaxID=585030 RepID=A0ABR3AF93_9AGAR|nr:hypothetical protein PM082_002931 [Marasmius tenuissimus]